MRRWGGAKAMLTLFQNGVSSLPSGKYQYIDVALHCVSNDNTQPSHWRGMYTGSILSSSPKQDIIGHQIFICLLEAMPHTNHQKTPLEGKTNILYIFPLMICGGQSPKWNLAESFANKSHLALSKLLRGWWWCTQCTQMKRLEEKSFN